LTEKEDLRNLSQIIKTENENVTTKQIKFNQVERVLQGRNDNVLSRTLKDDLQKVGTICQTLQGRLN